ncbi:MAG: hypothetical protein O2923_09010 [Verrucomicrobia bacterium]|nr:hypothetical protein [Verrucomicrobiota bacterium]MDA1087847.1 hypothetical protein [Verrucomicrobiota bacterium]
MNKRELDLRVIRCDPRSGSLECADPAALLMIHARALICRCSRELCAYT